MTTDQHGPTRIDTAPLVLSKFALRFPLALWVSRALRFPFALLALTCAAFAAEPASAPAPEEAHQWVSNAELQDRLQRLYGERTYPDFDVAAELEDGATHRVVYRPKWPPALINSFHLDLTNPDLSLVVGKGGGSTLTRERIGGIAERAARQTGLRVLAGVNGGFWDASNRPVGVLAGGGRVYAASNHQWTFLLGASQKAFLGAVKLSRAVRVGEESVTLAGVNSAAPASGAHLYTAEFGDSTPPLENCRLAARLEFANGGRMRINEPVRANATEVREGPGPLELTAGQGWLAFCANGSPPQVPERLRQPDAEVEVALTTDALEGPVDAAVSAGPMLVVDGQVALDAGSAEFRRLAGGDLLARTGLGLSADGKKLILAAIDSSWFGLSRGATLQDLASELIRQGAYTALNLDGGSSTQAWVDGGVASRPAGLLGARPISDALFLCSSKPPPERK